MFRYIHGVTKETEKCLQLQFDSTITIHSEIDDKPKRVVQFNDSDREAGDLDGLTKYSYEHLPLQQSLFMMMVKQSLFIS